MFGVRAPALDFPFRGGGNTRVPPFFGLLVETFVLSVKPLPYSASACFAVVLRAVGVSVVFVAAFNAFECGL